MFGFFSKKDETKNLPHPTDPQAENIPIHTMTRDIESLSHPGKESSKAFPTNVPRPDSKAEFNSPSELQKNSPFFNRQAMSDLPTPPVPRRQTAPDLPMPPVPRRQTMRDLPTPLILPSGQAIHDLPTPSAPKSKLESFVKPAAKPSSQDSFDYNSKIAESDTIIGDDPTKNGTKKLVVILVIILLITATAAGGYYFWNTRKSTPEEVAIVQDIISDQDSETLSEEEENGTEDQPASIFSATEKNYFMLDLGSNSLVSFKGMIVSYYEKIADSEISYPVEFTIINTENSPISFKTFAQTLGIKFSLEMMSALEDDFNLYIYDDQGNPGIGLSLKVKSGMNPEETLLKEEANLPQEFEPLFPVSQYTIEAGKAFATSEYDSASWGKVGIRFQNIISPEDLSLDYSFVNTGESRLFMGTTKATIRAIIENAKPPIVVP